jgi:3-ketosteroid 9alpha-monooxygenase subunit A
MSASPGYRFPFSPYPSGWYCVGLAREVEVGSVGPLHYFGRELVVFRADDGVIRVADAHCPHLGAHLGHGGRIDGDGIRCPFHAWRFDAQSGVCSDIPYAKRIPARAQLRLWPSFEYCGLIIVYHDETRAAPSWTPELPSCEPDAWSIHGDRRWRVRTHIQEIGENGLDIAHIPYVHGSELLEVVESREEGPVLRIDSRPQRAEGAKFDGLIRRTMWGIGLSLNEFLGEVETRVFLTRTPIDEEHVEVRMLFIPRQYDNARLTKALGDASMARVAEEFEGDIAIWENKAFLENPLLCDGDGPLGRWRVWTRQFYPDASGAG